MINWNEILADFAHKCGDGGPDMTNPNHLALLRESLLKSNTDFNDYQFATNEFLGNLREGKEIVTEDWWSDLGPEGQAKYIKAHPKSKKAQEAEAEKDEEDEVKEPAPNKPISLAEIDDIDGDSKDRVMNGEDPPPGTKSSAVSEIGTGYAMACLDTSPKDVDGCLKDKLDTTVLGSSSANNNETKRKQMIRTARREKQRVNETLEREGMNPDNTKVSHIGGSQSSLDDAVETLVEMEKAGITHIPGPPPKGVKIADTLDAKGNVIEYGYKSMIKMGGGGEDPTDTIVFMIEYDDTGKPIKAAINHTSNKMTSDDQQSNSGPKKTANNNNERAKRSLPKSEHGKADKIAKDTTDEIAKERTAQAKYVGGYTQRLDTFAKDPKTLDMIYKRMINGRNKDDDPKGISKTPGKYLEVALKRIGLSKKERDKLLTKNKPPATGYSVKKGAEKELKKHLATYLSSLKDKTPGVTITQDRDKGMGGEDIAVISRLCVDETMITGNDPIDPAMTDADLRSYYDNQTKALNKQREDLNKLGAAQNPPNPTLGNKTFIRDLLGRMHLNIAEGHNAGATAGPPKNPGIPNDNFDLIHGEYKNLKALGLKQDAKGNMYANGDGGFYKLDKNGNPTGNPIPGNQLDEFDCAVVGNPAVHRECLGLKEGEKVEEGFDVTYKEYQMEDGSDQIKAIIYDRKGKIIATQTCRPKSGPGGMIQDSMKWGQEYQKCMAIATKKLGLCG